MHTHTRTHAHAHTHARAHADIAVLSSSLEGLGSTVRY
jgi:hypothetical protein